MVRNGKKQSIGGRPLAIETVIAVSLIEESDRPISTNDLLAKVKVLRNDASWEGVEGTMRGTRDWKNRCIAIRRYLGHLAKRGKIQRLGTGPDGTHLWAPNSLSALECAKAVADEILRARQADARLEPEDIQPADEKTARREL